MFSKDTTEGLLLLFCGLFVVSVVICALVGYEIDELWGGGVGVTISIFAFFASCWMCWIAAVRLTKPRGVP